MSRNTSSIKWELVMDCAYLKTPIGVLKIEADESFLTEISFAPKSKKPMGSGQISQLQNPQIQEAVSQLSEYFSGDRKKFNLKLATVGTDFQQGVWKALSKIPYSKTASYGEIAKNISNPKASRAVGMANNKNKFVVVIPCHRVIGSSGKLVGYGGGIEKKIWLLRHEGIDVKGE